MLHETEHRLDRHQLAKNKTEIGHFLGATVSASHICDKFSMSEGHTDGAVLWSLNHHFAPPQKMPSKTGFSDFLGFVLFFEPRGDSSFNRD
jgi:hypothetical protein